MKEEYVSYSQAVKLKKLGFDWDVNKVYHRPSTLAEWELFPWLSEYNDWNNEGKFYRSAPTLSIAQKWLREVKGIDVEVSCIIHNLSRREYKVCLCYFSNDLTEYRLVTHGIHAYELALSAGIDAALELLTDKLNDK